MSWFTFENVDWTEMAMASVETMTMLGASLFFTLLLGLPLGIVLFLSGPGQIFQSARLHLVLSLIVNWLRSLPFIILLILMMPFTVKLVGTSIGVLGSIPPLVVGATPFFARLVETVLKEIDEGIIEACQSMGAKPWQIIFKVILPEALPGLTASATVTAITLVSYASMSGVVGGGGLGDLSIRAGYQRFQTDVMLVAVALLLVFVQFLQIFSDKLVRRLTKHK